MINCTLDFQIGFSKGVDGFITFIRESNKRIKNSKKVKLVSNSDLQ